MDEPGTETIVLDNASRDASAQAVAEQFPSVRLLALDDNLGFAGGVNRAASEATGDALLILNADARMEPRSLAKLADFLDAYPRAGLVAPALRYPDGRAQPAAFRFPGLAQVLLDLFPVDRLAETTVNGRIHLSEPAQIDHPLGACMLVRRAAWEDVGALDEGYFMYLEEVDWCKRAR